MDDGLVVLILLTLSRTVEAAWLFVGEGGLVAFLEEEDWEVIVLEVVGIGIGFSLDLFLISEEEISLYGL